MNGFAIQEPTDAFTVVASGGITDRQCSRACIYECLNGGHCVDGGCLCIEQCTCRVMTSSSLDTGADCSITTCFNDYCNNNGVCFNGTCHCHEDYVGEFCEHENVCGDAFDCLHGGQCLKGFNGPECVCNNTYWGVDCNTTVCTGFHVLIGREGYIRTASSDDVNMAQQTDVLDCVNVLSAIDFGCDVIEISVNVLELSPNMTIRISQAFNDTVELTNDTVAIPELISTDFVIEMFGTPPSLPLRGFVGQYKMLGCSPGVIVGVIADSNVTSTFRVLAIDMGDLFHCEFEVEFNGQPGSVSGADCTRSGTVRVQAEFDDGVPYGDLVVCNKQPIYGCANITVTEDELIIRTTR